MKKIINDKVVDDLADWLYSKKEPMTEKYIVEGIKQLKEGKSVEYCNKLDDLVRRYLI